MRAKQPESPLGSSFKRAAISTSKSASPSRRPGGRRVPCAAWSTRPPGERTWFRKLKKRSSGVHGSCDASCDANWQDIPPPESMPAHLRAATAPSSWRTASHSARASSSPLSTVKLARLPRQALRRHAKDSSWGGATAPWSRAWRTPAVAPTSTGPSGSCSANRPTRPCIRTSSCKANASASPRHEDFSRDTTGDEATPGSSASSVKQIARVEPLPQSTTVICAGLLTGTVAKVPRKLMALLAFVSCNQSRLFCKVFWRNDGQGGSKGAVDVAGAALLSPEGAKRRTARPALPSARQRRASRRARTAAAAEATTPVATWRTMAGASWPARPAGPDWPLTGVRLVAKGLTLLLRVDGSPKTRAGTANATDGNDPTLPISATPCIAKSVWRRALGHS
mmetsp:Transcript_15583/g.33059  ORF Transcript_15583/g.33059 Transcript_15583/m.33059 type:complete len:395 (-) Transcript_15583:2-1186(-)